MFSFLLVVQIIVSVTIIALVMLQQGKGADMGAGFGAGASGTVFGSRGSGSFFTRATAILAVIFFINCLLIASPLIRDHSSKSADTIAEQLEQQAIQQQEAEQTNAVIDALEQQEAAELGAPVEITETVIIDSDVPDVPAEAIVVPAVPGIDDLPE